jgi:hypothetical protein
VASTIDPLPLSRKKALFDRGPDIFGRLFPKQAFIAFESSGIPVLKPIRLYDPTLRGAVVYGFPEDVSTKLLPVGVGVDEMEMPSLIDLFGRRYGMIRANGEKHESLVFLDHFFCESIGPSVFSGETMVETKYGGRLADREGFDSLP